MVGVPKQSRGCSACRKRRATCDLKKPECSRCSQDNLICKVAIGFTFVVNEPGSHKTTYRKPRPVTVVQKEAATYELCADNQVKSLWKVLPPDAITRMDNTICPSIFSPALLQQQLHARAISDVGGWRIHDASLMKVWMLAIQTYTGSSTVLKGAPLACYVSWSARGEAAERMASVSRHLYVQGLKEVRSALRTKKTAEDDETLAACAALAMYEAIECPDSCRTAYELHERASIKLVQLRGARKHQWGVAHQLFLAVRVHGILDAFESRRPNYLCTKEWMTVPWEFEEKDAYHRLVDILASCPRLLQDADALREAPAEQQLPKLFSLISRLLDHDDQLENFYKELQSSSDAALYCEYQTTSSADRPNQTAQPPPFHFLSPETARLLTLYWTMLAVLWSGLEELHRVLAEHNALQILLSHPRGRRMCSLVSQRYWLHNIRNICRSNAYAVAAAQASQSPPVNGVALEIAVGIMMSKRGCEEELREACKARERIGEDWMHMLLIKGEGSKSVKSAVGNFEEPWKIAGLGDGGNGVSIGETGMSQASGRTQDMYVHPIRSSPVLFSVDFGNTRHWRPRR